MKGVILAGGKATRLRPLTWVTNKHLLPVYHKPMIFYALESMQRAGIQEVLITSSVEHLPQFINLLKSGRDFQLKLSYAIQEDAGGIPQAIALGEDFSGQEKILVILGDNIFTHNLSSAVTDFERQAKGAKVFAKHMPTDSKQYGVIELDKHHKVVSIEEKPEHPKSDLAQTGIYMYDARVYDFIRRLKPDFFCLFACREHSRTAEIFHRKLPIHFRYHYLAVFGYVSFLHQHHIPFLYMRVYH